VTAEGKTLIAGAFDALWGEPRANIARCNATEPATQHLSYDGSAVTWMRGGTSPEVWRTTFEYSTNLQDWVSAGAGARIPGGWRLTTSALPEGASLRARGFVVGGHYNASSWFVESAAKVVTPPLILANEPLFGIQSNQFHFRVSAVAGQTVVIESSTNLLNWFPVRTNVVVAPIFDCFAPVNLGSRFYRARVEAQ
jgi:hypothetical protein